MATLFFMKWIDFLLVRIQQTNSSIGAWCIFSNFNDLVSNDDKLGKNDHPNWLIHGFHEVISYGNLHDLPIDGYKYTWAHTKGKPNGIEELVEP